MAKYKFWTEQEIDDLKNGVIPDGRQYGDCLQKARNLGITFRKAGRKNGWTQEQIDMVKNGIIPEGKAFSAVSGYCKTILGFSFHQVHKNTPWTEEELESLRRGEKPVSRTANEYKLKQAELATSMLPSKEIPSDADDRLVRGKQLYEMVMTGHSLREIGRMYNISGERVRQLVNVYKDFLEQ